VGSSLDGCLEVSHGPWQTAVHWAPFSGIVEEQIEGWMVLCGEVGSHTTNEGQGGLTLNMV